MDFSPEEVKLKLREWDKEVERYQLLRIARESTGERRRFLPTVDRVLCVCGQRMLGLKKALSQPWLARKAGQHRLPGSASETVANAAGRREDKSWNRFGPTKSAVGSL